MDQPPAEVITGTDGVFSYFAGTPQERKTHSNTAIVDPIMPRSDIPDLTARRWCERTSDNQITFLRNSGTQSLQFAAVGGKTG
jgi:hypothetical protein